MLYETALYSAAPVQFSAARLSDDDLEPVINLDVIILDGAAGRDLAVLPAWQWRRRKNSTSSSDLQQFYSGICCFACPTARIRVFPRHYSCLWPSIPEPYRLQGQGRPSSPSRCVGVEREWEHYSYYDYYCKMVSSDHQR